MHRETPWSCPVTVPANMTPTELQEWLNTHFPEDVVARLAELPLRPASDFPHYEAPKMSAHQAGQMAKEVGITSEKILTPGGIFVPMGMNLYEAYIQYDPVLAVNWMRKFNLGNRGFRGRPTVRVANDIWSALFVLTHQGVAFARNPEGQTILLDGQHRGIGNALAGLHDLFLETGSLTWFPIRVTLNVPWIAKSTIDTTLYREQVASANGAMCSTLVTAGLESMIRGPSTALAEISSTRVAMVVAGHPEVPEFFAELQGLAEADEDTGGGLLRSGLFGTIGRALVCTEAVTRRNHLKAGCRKLFRGENPGEGDYAAVWKIYKFMTGPRSKGLTAGKLYRYLAPAFSSLVDKSAPSALNESQSENDPFPFQLTEVA